MSDLFMKTAALADDLFARAAYIEGLLNKPEHSLSRSPRSAFSTSLAALNSGESNAIVNALREHGLDDDDVRKMVGLSDTKIREVMLMSALKAVNENRHGTGSSRITTEEVVQSLTFGLNPLTSEPMKRFHGHGLFYHVGVIGRSLRNLSFAKLRRFVVTTAYRITHDILQGARNVESVGRQVRIDNELPATDGIDADSRYETRDMSTGPAPVDILFNDPSVLESINRAMMGKLKGPVQQLVWSVILKDPDLILIKPDGQVGVRSTDLARAVTVLTGREVSWSVIGRCFRDDVLPAMRAVLSSGRVFGQRMRDRDLHEVYQSDVQRMAKRIASRVLKTT